MKKLLSVLLVLVLAFSALSVAPMTFAAETDSPWAIQVCRKDSAGGGAFDYSNFDWSTLGENLIPDPTVANFDENGVYGKYAVPTNPENGEWAPSNINPDYWWDKYIQQYHGFEMYYQDMVDGKRDGKVNGTSYSYVLRSPANYTDGVTIGKYPSLTDDGSGVLRRKSSGGMQYYSLPTLEANSYYVVKLNVKSASEITGGNLDICLPKPNNFSPDVSAADATTYIYLQDFAINKVKTAAFVVYTGSKTYTEAFIGAYVTTELFFDDFGVYKVSADYANNCAAGTKLNEIVNEADIQWAIQTARTSDGARIDYNGFDWSLYGENLVPDPTVAHFEDGVYGEYATPDASWKPTNINPYYWWDKFIEENNGFTLYKQDMVDGTLDKSVDGKSYTNGFQSPKSRSMPKTTGSLTDDGTGVLQMSSGGGTRAVPLPKMEAYKYYVIKFNIKCAGTMSAGVDLCLTPDITQANLAKDTEIASSVNVGPGYADNKVETISYVVYTGKNTYNDPFVKIYCSGSILTFLDDFGVYEVTEAYAKDCSECVKLNDVRSYIYPAEYSISDGMSNNGYHVYDYSKTISASNTKLGENLVTDANVSAFENGVYSSTGWWDTLVEDWHGNPNNDGSFASQGNYLYASPDDRGLVVNDSTISHTDDGSGAIKIVTNAENDNTTTSKRDFRIPLPKMEKYSYYLVSFWIKTDENVYDILLQMGLSTDAQYSIASFTYIGNGWKQVAAVIYTGSKDRSKPYLRLLDNDAISDTIILDDFAMYKINDMAYGAACVENNFVIADGVDYKDTELLAKDLDRDGAINAADVTILRKHLLGTVKVKNAKINDDDTVDLKDLVALKKLLVS